MAAVCSAYWYPAYGFFRHLGCNADDACDATQGFFMGILSRNDLARVDRDIGPLRTWFRTAARHHFLNLRKPLNPSIGASRLVHVPIDVELAERRLRAELQESLTAEQLFDRCWARSVFDAAVRRLRARYPKEHADHSLFLQVLGPEEGEPAPATAAELAAELGISAGTFRARKSRLKDDLEKELARCVREEISETVDRRSAIDIELRELVDALP